MAFARILVPVDGSRRSATVVSYITDLATPSESRVHLLTVLATSDQEPGFSFAERGAVGQLRSAYDEASLRRYLDILAQQLQEKGLEVETEIRRGVPSQEILGAALEWRCDVIAMATKARRGLKRLVLGSVAEGVLRESRLPVLLIAV